MFVANISTFDKFLSFSHMFQSDTAVLAVTLVLRIQF